MMMFRILRIGSAAPQRSWSPQVNAGDVVPGPSSSWWIGRSAQIRVPLTAAGVRCLIVDSLSLGMTLTQSLAHSMRSMIASRGTSLLSFDREALAVERMAPPARRFVHRNRLLGPRNLVGFYKTFPFLAGLAVFYRSVDPRDSGSRERDSEILNRKRSSSSSPVIRPSNLKEQLKSDWPTDLLRCSQEKPSGAIISLIWFAPAPEAAW